MRVGVDYYTFSLGVFAYVIFGMNASPWWFALMIVLDLLYYAYTRNEVL
jgi:hypothetical protein